MAAIQITDIIDTDYFVGEILLTNKTALLTDINQAINEYGEEILISLLGYSLYKSMINDSTSEPYKSLIEGAEFELTYSGITQTLKWQGLKNSYYKSLIAYYVYYKYQERNFIKPGAIGTNKPKAEAGDIVSPYPKMVNAWNRMIQLYGFFPHYNHYYFSSNNGIIQPDGGLIYDSLPSAYNYMCANIDSFSDWIFTPLRTINHFGI